MRHSLDPASAGLHRRQDPLGLGQRGPIAFQRSLQGRDPRRMTRLLGRQPVGDVALGGDLGLELRAARCLGAVPMLAALVREPREAARLFLGFLRRPARVAPARLETLATLLERGCGRRLAGRGLARLLELARRGLDLCLEAGEPVALGQILLGAAGGQAPDLSAASRRMRSRRA